MKTPTLIFLTALLFLFNPVESQTDPFIAANPLNIQVNVSNYPQEVKFMSGAFLNNIGGDDNLARQIQNLTNISNQILSKQCSTWQRFLTVMLPFVSAILFLGCLVLKTTLINFVHLIEFCQEIFIIMMMNVVRESCFYEFKLSLKSSFFVFTARNNVPSNPNILKRIFFQSVYFLENTAEVSFIIAGLMLIYMVMVTIHLMLHRPESGISKRMTKILDVFEFGFFFRMIQIFITPLTYFCFWGMRKFTFPNNTAIFDLLVCILYSFIIVLLLFIMMYVLNFLEIDMASKQSLKHYGALYEHVKYKQESKAITNETLFRNTIKVSIAGLHAFGFIPATGVCVTGLSIYLGYACYIIFSLRIDGLYTSIYNTFKMTLFHIVVAANYGFALAQINRSSPELNVTSFFIMLINNVMIGILMLHIVFTYYEKLKLKKEKKKRNLTKFERIYDENENLEEKEENKLNVSKKKFKFRNMLI